MSSTRKKDAARVLRGKTQASRERSGEESVKSHGANDDNEYERHHLVAGQPDLLAHSALLHCVIEF